MKTIDFTLKLGKGTVTFPLPEEQVLHRLEGRNRKPPADLTAAYRSALDHPIDSPPLNELVKPGELDGDMVHVPGIYVQRVVQVERPSYFPTID